MQKTSRNVFLRHPGWCVFHIFSMLQGFPQVLRTWKGSSKFDGGLKMVQEIMLQETLQHWENMKSSPS